MFKRAWAVFLSLVLMMGALAAAPRPVRADLSEENYQAAASQLNKYGLVQGDERGYRFYDQITRAEMAKLLIYSLGQQSQAAKYAGRGSFKDTNGHWAEGIIALAKLNGIMKGYPDGTFKPGDALTYAEVITALARLAGVQGSSLPWPRTYLGPAQEAGIVPDGMELYSRLDQPAARGDVFVLLWRSLTVVKNQKGENLLRTYLDHSAPILTVDPQPTETTDLTLTVSGTAQGADRVMVNGTQATLTFGYFQATVNLRLGPNTIRVQALDDAGNMKEQAVQITRKQSPNSSIALTGPASVAAGDNATFTITLKDQNDQAVLDRKGVTATVAPDSLGAFDATTGVFTAGTKPGTGTITVKAGTVQSSVNVAVVPAPLDHLTVDPPVAALEGKQSIVFTAKGADKYGNEVPLSNPQWTASAGTISAAGVYVAPDTAGQYAVTVSAGGKSATAQVQPPNYKAKSVRLSQPSTALRANGTATATITATVLDDSGNPLTDYVGSLTVASSQPSTAAPVLSSVPVTNGTAQISVRAGTVPGPVTVTASTNLSGTGTVQFTVAPQQLQSIRLSGYPTPGSLNARATGYVEAVALDQDGYPMYTPLTQTVVILVRFTPGPGAGTLRFVQNDQDQANVALGTLDPVKHDVRTQTPFYYDPGVGTVVIDGSIVSSSMNWVQVQSGAFNADQVGLPAKVAIEPIPDTPAGAAQSIYVVVLDSDGVRVTQAKALAGYDVQLRDQNGNVTTGTQGDGSQTDTIGPGRFQFSVTQMTAGTYTYTATLQPGGAQATRTALVTSGSADHVRLTASPDTLKADNASTATLRVDVLDANNNVVKDGTHTAVFRRVTTNGAIQPFVEKTVPTVQGAATIQVTAGTVVGPEDFQVTVDPDGPAWKATARITTRGLPERLAISYGDNNGNGVPGDPQDQIGRAGLPLIVNVDVLDRFGNMVTYENSRQLTLTLKNAVTGAETQLPAVTTTAGRAVFSVNRTDAGTYALKAESGALLRAVTAGYGGSVADMVIQPGLTYSLKVTADLTALQKGGTSFAYVRAQMVDAAGNPTANQLGRPVYVDLQIGPNDTGTFKVDDTGIATSIRTVQIPAGSSVSNAVKFFSGANTGTATISSKDAPSGSLVIRTVEPYPVATVSVDPIPTVQMEPWGTVAGALTGQTVTVRLKDQYGNQVSGATGTITAQVQDADSRVVAYYDPATQTWKTTDPGNQYVSALAVPIDRGQAQFRVRANQPGVKLYTFSYAVPGSSTPKTAQAYGRFDGNGPASLKLEFDRPRVRANSQAVATVRVLDRYGTPLTTVTGTILFEVDTGAGVWAAIGSQPLQNGVASAAIPAGGVSGTTQVRVSSPDIYDGSGVLLVDKVGSFESDAAPPRIVSLSLGAGPVDASGGAAGTVTEGDTMTFTFDGAIEGQSLMTGLLPGAVLTSNLGTVTFSGTGIKFNGLFSLTAVSVPGGTIDSTATYQISAIRMNADGTAIIITIGVRTDGTANPRVTVAAGAKADIETNPASPLRDTAGNSASGPFNADLVGGF